MTVQLPPVRTEGGRLSFTGTLQRLGLRWPWTLTLGCKPIIKHYATNPLTRNGRLPAAND